MTVTRVLQDGVELNWLPPTEPNGEVHYVIEYKREDSGNWTSANTTSETHYNLTGLLSGTNHTVRVVAVKSVGRQPITFASNSASVNILGLVAGAAAAILLLLTLLTTIVVIVVVVRRMKQKKGTYKFPCEWEQRQEYRVGSQMNGSREQLEAIEEDADFAVHCDRVGQHVDGLHDTSTDALTEGQDPDEVTGGYYAVIDASQEEAELNNTNIGQMSDSPTDSPDPVYAVVDKSKKKRGGFRATTVQDCQSEDLEWHYEFSSVIGVDWFGNVIDEILEGRQCEAVKDTNDSIPKPEPGNPNAVYAVVDKSKKRNRGKMNALPSLAEQAGEDKTQQKDINKREAAGAQQNDSDHDGDRMHIVTKGFDSSAPHIRSGLHGTPDTLELGDVHNTILL